ncbi:MAG: shikimate dehydrogenase [Oscillospiraceae bacterium]|nr:shikimate dehydrogenase [Oscillospiraceae bacterium]
MTVLLAIIGHPVSHSLSPRIHSAFAERYGLPYTYAAFDIAPERLEEFIGAARLLRMGGFNLTMPHKERVLPLLDEIDPRARGCAAVNTVVAEGDRLRGLNTDGDGFVLSLGGVKPSSALILGAGGASKSVALALARVGVKVTIAARRADGLELAGIEYISWDELPAAARGRDLLVNATPLGMHGVGSDFEDLSFLDGLEGGATVYDMIYVPKQTSLLREARTKGFAVMNGLPMLVWQAALAFKHFTGVMPDNTDEILKELLYE